MARTKRQYSDREKAEALVALDANDGNEYRTAKQIGVPRVTLRQWQSGAGTSPDVSVMRQAKTTAIVDGLNDLASKLIGTMLENVEGQPLNHQAVALGIVIDKSQLLSGAPTSIQQTNMTEDERMLRIAEILSTARAGREVG